MLTLVEKILFLLAVAASLYMASMTFNKMTQIILRGQGQLNFDRLPQRLWQGLFALVSQGQIIRHRPLSSAIHLGVAWGFIFYLLVNVMDVLEGFIPGFHLPGLVGDIYRLLADLLSVTVLIGVTYFLYRRFISQDKALTIRDNVTLHPKVRAGIPQDSQIVGIFILTHVGARFLSASFLVSAAGGDVWQPFANIVAQVWMGLPANMSLIGWHITWWIALGLILAFLPYFPYTKHAHLFMGPFNFMTRPQQPGINTQEAIDFEDEEVENFGATTLLDLRQTQLVDPFACIMCNRCQEVCPAYTTGKELSPSALEINKRYHIWEHFDALAAGEAEETPLMEFAISESAVWACTSCGACVNVCPVGNEPMLDILDIRRGQVLMESEFPEELRGAFTGMERNGNPWQMSEDRLAWTKSLDFAVPTVAQNPTYDYLYWVGCAGAFDPSVQEIARATVTVLHAAGVNFAVLGNQEACTGDVARRSGNEYLFYGMAMANIETLHEVEAHQRKIVMNCPHCLQTIGKEYADFGGHFTAMHHTQLIAGLLGSGQLKLNGDTLERTTFHDPCYLGRHNKIYDHPREALAQAGMILLEMDRSRSDSFCCGAGGAQVWKEEEEGTEAVNKHRYAEAQATGAKTLAIGCPFCARMLHDANNAAGGPMAVKDVAEVVVAALEQ